MEVLKKDEITRAFVKLKNAEDLEGGLERTVAGVFG